MSRVKKYWRPQQPAACMGACSFGDGELGVSPPRQPLSEPNPNPGGFNQTLGRSATVTVSACAPGRVAVAPQNHRPALYVMQHAAALMVQKPVRFFSVLT